MRNFHTIFFGLTLLAWMAFSIARASDDPQTITNQGSAYYYGKGVSQDRGKACQLFQQAALMGEKYAMFNLGNCLREGDYFDRDLLAAARSYRDSYALGYKPALVSYSMLVFFDNPEADEMRWTYEELLRFEDDQRVLFILGVIFSKGLVVEKDYEKALDYYERAAYKKNLVAAALLSYIFENGIYGQQPSPVKAYYWKGVFNAIGAFGENEDVKYEAIIDSLKRQALGID